MDSFWRYLFSAKIASNHATYGVKLLRMKENVHFADLSSLLGHNSFYNTSRMPLHCGMDPRPAEHAVSTENKLWHFLSVVYARCMSFFVIKWLNGALPHWFCCCCIWVTFNKKKNVSLCRMTTQLGKNHNVAIFFGYWCDKCQSAWRFYSLSCAHLYHFSYLHYISRS